MIFGVTLNRYGWRIGYLGADTPVEELTRTAAARPPDLAVLAATQPGMLEPLTAELARTAPLAPGRGRRGPAARRGRRAGRLAPYPVTAAVTIGWPWCPRPPRATTAPAGQGSLRCLPGPARMPGLRAGDSPGLRHLGRM